jgi:hypothetical protein
MKTNFTVGLLFVIQSVFAFYPNDSLVNLKLARMRVVAEVWKTQFNDTFICKTYSPSFRGRPVYLHTGNFPAGAEFDFMNAKENEVLGPYVDGNCISLYKFIGRASVPDSVKFSQILVAWKGAPGAEPYVLRSKEEARRRADSLCYELRTGRIFMDEMMLSESDDVHGLILNRGEYGWMTRTSDYPQTVIDAAFSQQAGAFVVAESNLGYHVISVDEQSHVWNSYAAWEIQWCIDSCYSLHGDPVSTGAVFPGGDYAMEEFFNSEKTHYDSLDVAGAFDYPVLVFFDVLEDGSTAHVEVLYQEWITPGILIDITKLVKSMPKWTPAQTCSGAVKERQAVVIYL